MICQEFIMLGKSVPEPVADGRHFVCSAGFNKELGLMRVYPLSMKNTPKRWHKYWIPLERNPKDSRPESWRIEGNRAPGKHRMINNRFQETGICMNGEKEEILDYKIPPFNKYRNSIEYFNERFASLGIIHPVEIPELLFKENTNGITFSHPRYGSKKFPYLPYLRFLDENPCKTRGRPFHELAIREWGIFELMRKTQKETYDIDYYSSALKLQENPPLLVGNHNKYRSTWLIIAILR